MTSPSSILQISDGDEYATMVRSIGRLTVAGRGPFHATIRRCGIGGVMLQEVSLNQPVVASLTMPGKLAVVGFALADDEHVEAWDGVPLRPDQIVIHRPGEETQLLGSAKPWGSLTLSLDSLEEYGVVMGRSPLSKGRAWRMVRPPGGALARLRALHRQAIRAVGAHPGIEAAPAAREQLADQLLRAVLACLPDDAPSDVGSVQRARALRRLKDLLDGNAIGNFSTGALCRALNVSERTLHRICLEGLGMGAQRYFRLRRLDMVQQELATATAGTTVADVATRFGFWELGRFAAAYKERFGELPSLTLRRAVGAA